MLIFSYYNNSELQLQEYTADIAGKDFQSCIGQSSSDWEQSGKRMSRYKKDFEYIRF